MNKIIPVRDQVYETIKFRVANGTYKHGMHLQEIALAEELQVSRSPVREALKQLVAEELLIASANKGVYVREFTEKELKDIFDFRIMIEDTALSFLTEHPEKIPKQQLLDIRSNIEKLRKNDIDYAVSDEVNPHYAIVAATGNEYIARRHRHASYCTMSFHYILFSDAYEESVQAHQDIIDHILNEDFVQAKKALHEHLLSSRDHICKAIKTA